MCALQAQMAAANGPLMISPLSTQLISVNENRTDHSVGDYNIPCSVILV